jgi:hypothetical protein
MKSNHCRRHPPGSIITTLIPNSSTLIPNSSSSYDIDSPRPSKANLVLMYADIPGRETRLPQF